MNISTCPYCGSENHPGVQRCVTCHSDINQKALAYTSKFGASGNVPNYSAANRPPHNQLQTAVPDTGTKRISIFRILFILGILGIAGLIYANYFIIDEISKLSAFDQYYYAVKTPTNDDLQAAILDRELNRFIYFTKDNPFPVKYPVGVKAFDVESAYLQTNDQGQVIYSVKYKALIKYGSYVQNGELGFRVKDEDAADSYGSTEFGLTLRWDKNTKKWEKEPLRK